MSVEMIPVLDSTDPVEVVRFTQKTRYQMFNKMTDNGTDVISNFKEVSGLLRDMDGAALMTRKLDIDEKSNDDAARVQANHVKLREMLGGRDPFRISDDSPLPIAERVDGVLPGQIPKIAVTFVPGEDAQGEQALVVSDFVSVDE